MSVEEKSRIPKWVQQACAESARQAPACKVIGISATALQRWKAADSLIDKRQTTVKYPANKLTELKQFKVHAIVNSKEYADLPPSQIGTERCSQNALLSKLLMTN